MKIVRRRPPFYALIALFIGTPPSGTVFTCGSTVYSPDLASLTNDLETHERMHKIQQGRTPWLWWARYLVDKRFRVAQETQAYRAQLKTFPRSQRTFIAHHLALHLAGPMYGKAISVQDAIAAIT